eukprot:5988985-Amphidinium_carterae.1
MGPQHRPTQASNVPVWPHFYQPSTSLSCSTSPAPCEVLDRHPAVAGRKKPSRGGTLRSEIPRTP